MNKTIYLAGPMESSEDGGLAWRREYQRIFKEQLGFECIVPNDDEKKLMFDNLCENVVIKELKQTNIDEYIKIIRIFIDHDLKTIESVDMIVSYFDGTFSSGTSHEVGYAYQLKKPCYLVSSVPYQNVPGWFLSCFTERFHKIEELIEYLKK